MTTPEHDQPDHEGPFLQAIENKQEYDKSNLNIANMYEVLIMVGIRKVVMVWSLDTNEAHEVAMANF